MSPPHWSVDPDDPRAPPQEVWDRMSPEERARAVESLPAEVPIELHPPEGDEHREPKDHGRDALNEFFKRTGRRVYVTSELAVYYPNEPRFCPDILAVCDVEPHPRQRWVVSDEGKGLDLVIEIHVGGHRKKDFEINVDRYARLGIPEYFIFDRPGQRLLGFRLGGGAGSYERIVPQGGRFRSDVLGLDLLVEGNRLRFYHATAPLLFMDELVGKLNTMVAELTESRDAAMKRAEAEAERADQLAERVRELEAEIERLKSR